MALTALARASSALSFLGIGRGVGAVPAPAAKKPPKADEESPEAKEKREAAEAEAARNAPPPPPPKDDKPTGEKPDPDDDGDDDDKGDDDDEGDPDSDRDEMKGKGKKGKQGSKAAARMRERSRIAAIFAHPSAEGNAEMAARLAFTTDLDRAAACALLDTTPRGTSALSTAMAPLAGLRPGTGPEASGATSHQARAASWDAAATAAGVSKGTTAAQPVTTAASWDAAATWR